MTRMLRRGALMVVVSLPLLAGCATDGCEELVYEEGVPQETRPLTVPEGLQAPAESGRFAIPAGNSAATAGRCLAKPPRVLPEEVLDESAEES